LSGRPAGFGNTALGALSAGPVERDFFQMRAEREVTGRAEIANESIEAFDVGIVVENPGEFVQQGIGAFVGKKACGHWV